MANRNGYRYTCTPLPTYSKALEKAFQELQEIPCEKKQAMFRTKNVGTLLCLHPN